MGLRSDAGHSQLRIEEGLRGEDWAKEEFGGARLGDRRLTKRLIRLAELKGKHPGQGLLETLRGDGAAVQGYYRFVDHRDYESVSMCRILEPHGRRTLRRMAALPRVLVVHDHTDLNFSSLSECEGLGVIGKRVSNAKTRGLRLHTCFVLSEREGLPLGVFWAKCYAPRLKPERRVKDSRNFSIEQKETFHWVESLRKVMDGSKYVPRTRIINIMDRGADFFELFHEWRKNPCVDLLVRAKHDRRTDGLESLFSKVRSSPVCARVRLQVCRLSARPRRGKHGPSPPRPARIAEIEVRYRRVELLPPTWGTSSKHAPVKLWMIHAFEPNPPKGQERIEWYLLTTVEIRSAEDAVQCLKWYRLRWRIEDWHRVLKTCCDAEGLQNLHAERIKRLLAIYLVVAWRIMVLTLLGREMPELPSALVFTELEIEVLRRQARRIKKN